jgi:DNA repair exonuclease SbcCD ATPase subunit
MKLRQFKVLLERMAEVLHRDALPSRVMIGTMHTIAAKANEALPRLGKRFLTYVDGETFRVVFDDKRDLPAHMLSGGQAADWCVAFLFAIMELFSQELGLLIGDELTAEMDDNAVAALGEMLGTFSQILSNRSTQLIISTHHLSMGDYADRVIDVLTLNQPQEAA